jgi:sporulation protein YlmC with PRC-barrel domain
MRFTEAHGHKVVSTSTAETVGRVEALLVDPASRRVVALELKKAKDGDTLLWSNITAFGADAVTVAGAELLTPATPSVAALSGKTHALLGKRVLSSSGDELGSVADVEFDAGSGEVTGLLVHERMLAGSTLVGVGSYAVVVDAVAQE